MEKLDDFRESPFQLYLSFNKLMLFYEGQLNSNNRAEVANASYIIDAQSPYPILREGIKDFKNLRQYEEPIAAILKDIFSSPLTKNEIKMATLPFQNFMFMHSSRLESIVKAAGDKFRLKIDNLSDDEYYIMACTVISKLVYGFDIKYKRPFFYEIPDASNVMRHYKILYNGDFVEIHKTKNAPALNETDFNELLDNFQDIDVWKKKFPPNSYIFKGFIIANLVDVTEDQSISNIKTALIADGKKQDESFAKDFKEVFRSLFGFNDLDVGFSIYNKEQSSFVRIYGDGLSSYLLNDQEERKSHDTLCKRSYNILINKKQFYSISDIEKFYAISEGKSPQYVTLKQQGYKSSILAPIASGNELLGVLELVSRTPKLLNSVNANRLKDVMPFIVSSVERSKREQENLIEAVIQQECTAIHNSIKWKFEKAAFKFIQESYKNGEKPQFDEVIVKDVYPLYGQVDVKGSSDARNFATQNDLLMQLGMLSNIFNNLLELESIPYLEQLAYQITMFQEEIGKDFKVDSEQQICNFIIDEVDPVLRFQSDKHSVLKNSIEEYFETIDTDVNLIYFHRKKYDDTVALINKNLSTYLDKMQLEAQSYFPHYFERFKTDGVDHNMYIGKAIARNLQFNEMYLYNLRLWQLQVMCEMENLHYSNQHQYPLALDLASMILVFNQPLTIRFRMDEKKFDVDGTYNARYEVIKKRVDKACIKGTNERITQKGNMCIVYSHQSDEKEYLGYIDFMQSKGLLGDNLEIVEVQDLQGISGLKAILVNILYQKNNDKTIYTYNDLLKTLKE